MNRAIAWALLLAPAAVGAQGTAVDYQRSDSLRTRLQGLVVDAPGPPTWIGTSDHFWYRKSVAGGNAFELVDATTLEKRPAFDHAKIATALSAATAKTYTAITLPFSTLTFTDSMRSIDVTVDSVDWRCTLTSYQCARNAAAGGRGGRGGRGGGGPIPAAEAPRPSPDGKWEAVIRNYNVFIRAAGSSEESPLSLDGSEGNGYTARSIAWSPDSRKLAAYRVRPGYQRMVHYVESSPTDQIQPKASERFYAKPGDVLDVEQPILFDIATRHETVIDNALFPNAYDMTSAVWRHDSRAFTFEYNQRGHQVYRVIEVDGATGTARAVIEERSPTFFEYSAKKYRFDIEDGKEVLWMSERSGWNHLYLYDGITGAVKNAITTGDWVVRGVERVDTLARKIWFRASGMYPGKDPYLVHYYVVNFDGSGLQPLTDADGMHSASVSPDRKYYVDTWSRVDLAPISQLHATDDGKLLLELERGDYSAQLKTGWRPPEVFTAKGRDGITDIWGVIIRPTNFDPKKKYPVIENIYAGPQDAFVPTAFSAFSPMQALAELGFIVVQIDGMGTSNRSKAFHDVAWKNLGDAGFPDRILWHKAVAARYKYYDIARVGIYGTSAGGQNALGGLLFHPEFYKVGFAAAGSHDNRMDKIWWNEQWMGWPIGPEYAASSNVDNAWRLQGKLMLVVGEMDTNVDPSSTMQVVNALIKANKMFDLLVIPGAGHTSGGAYGDRKRNDFFVHNLLGVEPPDRNGTAASPPPPLRASGGR